MPSNGSVVQAVAGVPDKASVDLGLAYGPNEGPVHLLLAGVPKNYQFIKCLSACKNYLIRSCHLPSSHSYSGSFSALE